MKAIKSVKWRILITINTKFFNQVSHKFSFLYIAILSKTTDKIKRHAVNYNDVISYLNHMLSSSLWAASLGRAWQVTDSAAVYLSIALTKDKPGPRQPPRDTTKRDTSKAAVAARAKATKDSAARAPKPPKPNPAADTLPIDFTLELEDADGHVARTPMSRYGPVRRPLEAHIYRRAGRDEQRFQNLFEIVPQTYVVPLADFGNRVPQLAFEIIRPLDGLGALIRGVDLIPGATEYGYAVNAHIEKRGEGIHHIGYRVENCAEALAAMVAAGATAIDTAPRHSLR